MLLRAILRGDLRTAFITLALSLPAIVLCLSVHEAAHGAAAYLLGDRTARNAGRVTLSPLAHIDPMGFACLLLFGFGWALPVPVNISNFKNRRWGMALTALAGPLSNFVTAFIAYCLYLLVWMNSSSVFMQTLGMFLSIVGSMSVGLGVFNLIPVPSARRLARRGRLSAVLVVAPPPEIPEYHPSGVYRGAVVRLARRPYEPRRERDAASGGALRGSVYSVNGKADGISLRQL